MKLTTKRTANRLVIFFFFDKEGIVDRYVSYMLESIKKCASRIFVVCNGKLSAQGRRVLTGIAGNAGVLVRENSGFDVWAYKTAILHIGWAELEKFDEVVLMNFTMFGPIRPFSEMFNEMAQRDVDFWGITKHHGAPIDPWGCMPWGYIPPHIQSSFIVVRNSMLRSSEFHAYWESMPPVLSYGEAVGKHEARFTKEFEEKGFVSDVYVNTEDLANETIYPLMIEPTELLENRKCPVFKRKSFTGDYYEILETSCGEITPKMYEYIRKNTSYDLGMVWENILRTDNMALIKDRMSLNYVFPKHHAKHTVAKRHPRVALALHLYFADLLDQCVGYARSMPFDADIYVTVVSEEMKILAERKFSALSPRKTKVILIPNRGRDVSSLLLGVGPFLKNYDYVCFAHDKKTKQVQPLTLGKSWMWKCFESLLASTEYVENVIARFEEEPHLGMLTPPPPSHGGYFALYGCEWGSNFENTVKLAKELKVNVPMDIRYEPICPLGTMFWFRPRALDPILKKKWTFDDFPEEPNKTDGTILHAVERMYGFSCQSMGYYCAWCVSDELASYELTNGHFALRELVLALNTRFGHHEILRSMRDRIYGDIGSVKKYRMMENQLKQVNIISIGLKGALKVWLNKHFPFLFKDYARKYNSALQIVSSHDFA